MANESSVLCAVLFSTITAGALACSVPSDPQDSDTGMHDASTDADTNVSKTDDATDIDAPTASDATSDSATTDEVAVEGDIDSREPCTVLCEDEGLTCNDEHVLFPLGTQGGTVTNYGGAEQSRPCDYEPPESQNGDALVAYTCYCHG